MSAGVASEQKIFGKYQLLRRLAVGGMGEVFLARQTGVPGFERDAILKSLLPDLAEQPEFVNLFLDEARVAATLNHPNVVSIYEVGAWEGMYFIAMEYIPGLNLAQLVQKARAKGLRVPVEIAARIIHDAALGLHHAHAATDGKGKPLGLVHRDISPHNLMVRDDGLTKVVDFGIARWSNRSTKTATGVVKGKLGYMSPEQLMGDPLDAASDVFALGAVAFELCTSKELFARDRDQDTIDAVMNAPIPRVREFNGDVPPPFSDLIERMVTREKEKRIGSCAEVARALQPILFENAQASSPEEIAKFVAAVSPPKTEASRAKNFLMPLSPKKPEGTTPMRLPPDSEPSKARAKWPIYAAVTAGLLLLAGGGAAVVASNRAEDPLPVVPVEPPKPVVAVDPPKPVEVAPTPVEPSEPPKPVVAEAPRPPVERKPKPPVEAPKPPAEKPVVAALPGFITVDTKPWTKVSLNGQPLGSTPIWKMKAPAGAQTLVFVNEEAGIKTERTVQVPAGGDVKVTYELQK